MTNEEAIKTLEANYPDACFEQLREAVDAAIDALKKQIPVKPVKSKEERYGMGYEYHDWICPSCGRFLAPEPTQTGNHHCKCGQAIDWNR